MRYQCPTGLLAGFHAERPEPAVPELRHVGEQWAPRTYRIPDHAHATWEFYLQLDGESRWDGPGGPYALIPTQFFAVPPHVPHRLCEVTPARHHFFFAAIDLAPVLARLPELARLWARGEIVYAPQGEALVSPFRHLIREVSLALPHRGVGMRLALDGLVLEASRLAENAACPTSLVFSHPAVLRAKELLEHAPGRAWRLADLSRRAGLSPHHLVECFTRDVGVPPRRFLLQVRVERAKELLAQSDVAVADLALELGFSSSQHFAATFRKATGQTARQYRARQS